MPLDIEGYNVANQLVYDGTNTLTYDDNGNLTSDGVNSYSWDRANRLLSVGSAAYQYDGVGNRIRQTVSSIVTDYLNDVQPGLTKLLAQTTGATTERFIHAPRGIHAMEENSGNWTYPVQDGLGSVRGVVSDALAVNGMQHYAPYGDPFGAQGSLGMDFGFTGEQTDGSGQVFLRARYYDPGLGVFTALDPFEGRMDRPMSLNGYLYVEGNVVNAADPSGMIYELPSTWDNCAIQQQFSFIPQLSFTDTSIRLQTQGDASWLTESTVIIAIGDDVSSDPFLIGNQCSQVAPREFSLGTLVPDGIWTHDHYSNRSKRTPQQAVLLANFKLRRQLSKA